MQLKRSTAAFTAASASCGLVTSSLTTKRMTASPTAFLTDSHSSRSKEVTVMTILANIRTILQKLAVRGDIGKQRNYNPSHKCLESPKPNSDHLAFCGSTSGLLVTREHRGSVELVRSSNKCINDFESTEEGFCCPDFRVTTWALCIDHRSADCQIDSWLLVCYGPHYVRGHVRAFPQSDT